MRRLVSRLFSGLRRSRTEGTTETKSSQQTSLVEEIIREQFGFARIEEQPYTRPTHAIADVKQLKREKRHAEAEELLLWCIDFVEAEAEGKGYDTPSHAYYRHLAIIYRKDFRYDDEIELLERYLRVCETLGGEPSTVMLERLERVHELTVD
jgi:hypothetical protein